MKPEFVHLHLHTEYSLLDGACRVDELVAQASQLRMPALAITDHGNMFGAVAFYDACHGQGVKPIIGCEAYVATGSRHDKQASGIREAYNHLTLLASNETGYHNLLRLVSLGYTEGFYHLAPDRQGGAGLAQRRADRSLGLPVQRDRDAPAQRRRGRRRRDQRRSHVRVRSVVSASTEPWAARQRPFG